MTIESRIEIPPNRPPPDYLGKRYGPEQVAQGVHRSRVGGRWDELGLLQLEFLKARGLAPHDRMVDVGCGSLRAGRWLVDYLDVGNYYGIDINAELIEAGYRHELTDGQRERLPEENLRATDRFDADFGVPFDVAIAQSVFTHISLNQIRLCLERLATTMAPGGRFFATFFEGRPDLRLHELDRGRYSERNVFWYYADDLRWAAQFGNWEFNYIGDWNHPVRQRMIEFTKT